MTLTEMRERMSNSELHVWAAYIERNGPLSAALRTDAAVARAVSPFLKGTTPRDLMPWPKEPEHEATTDDVMNMLKGLRKH